MNKTLNAAYAIESTPVQLTERDAACITNGRGSVVRVERGSVWMTQDGCTDDTVLGIGESQDREISVHDQDLFQGRQAARHGRRHPKP